jgi:hypothetical protein
MDTGLCAYLTGWLNEDVLERGAMSGAMLETWLVSEIIKSYLHHGRTPRLYFYRDKDKREVDVLIEENGTIYPIEIKKTASIQNMHFKGFDMLNTLGMPIGHGGYSVLQVLCCHCQKGWMPFQWGIFNFFLKSMILNGKISKAPILGLRTHADL